jgi:hypothetical protein
MRRITTGLAAVLVTATTTLGVTATTAAAIVEPEVCADLNFTEYYLNPEAAKDIDRAVLATCGLL